MKPHTPLSNYIENPGSNGYDNGVLTRLAAEADINELRRAVRTLAAKWNCQNWEARQAQHKLNQMEAAPDSYHTALERLDKHLETIQAEMKAAWKMLKIQQIVKEEWSALVLMRQARKELVEALGGTDEEFES